MSHYTEKFKEEVLEPVRLLMIETGGEVTPDVQLLFRNKCLVIGHKERVKNLYRVAHKVSQEAEFFSLNGPQERYMDNKTNRSIILKMRQVGFTTLQCIRALDLAMWETNMKTGIMAHTELAVKTIFADLVKFSFEWFKKDWGQFYAPVQRSDSASALMFSSDGLGRDLHSSIRVLFDFRSKTTFFLHISEASRIENERLLGSLNGVPDNGEIAFESTPYGRGGEFYRLWQEHRRIGHNAPYKGHFIPWFEYYPEEPEKWTLEEGFKLDEIEKQLKSQYNLEEYHIAWRRYCIAAKCQGDSEKFDNEYPSDDVTCFFTGENQVFSKEILMRIDRNLVPPSKTGHLTVDGKKLVFIDDPKGQVALWEVPKPNNEYVIGCDPAGGVGKDASAAFIINRTSRRIVGRIWGQLEPADMANEIYKIAKYYNHAFICVEVNNHGGTVINILKSLQYRNLYKRKHFDAVTQKLSNQYGFQTTNESKLMITEKLKSAVKDGRLYIPDADLLDEMSSFVQIASKNGRSIRREATPGRHDDLVMAAAFAYEMLDQRGDAFAEDEDTSELETEHSYLSGLY